MYLFFSQMYVSFRYDEFSRRSVSKSDSFQLIHWTLVFKSPFASRTSTIMITECVFPTELLYQILGYTSARDVIRWRTVSISSTGPLLRPQVTHSSFLLGFKVLCHHLPAGNVESSAHFMSPPELSLIGSLDRVHIRSERLAQSWSREMRRPLRLLSRTSIEIPFESYYYFPFQYRNYLIGDRWFIMDKPYTVLCNGLVLYDTHPKAETREVVLWEERDKKIKAWYYSMATCREGRWVVYGSVLTRKPTWLYVFIFLWIRVLPL